MTRDSEGEVERMGPYATGGLQWVGFDDTKTIRQKSEFVLNNGFGGAMIWALDLDDFANRCGCENYPLLRTINRVLRNYSLPDPVCDIKATPAASVKRLISSKFSPNPAYGAPWVFSGPQNTPFTNVYYPNIRPQVYLYGR